MSHKSYISTKHHHCLRIPGTHGHEYSIIFPFNAYITPILGKNNRIFWGVGRTSKQSPNHTKQQIIRFFNKSAPCLEVCGMLKFVVNNAKGPGFSELGLADLHTVLSPMLGDRSVFCTSWRDVQSCADPGLGEPLGCILWVNLGAGHSLSLCRRVSTLFESPSSLMATLGFVFAASAPLAASA